MTLLIAAIALAQASEFRVMTFNIWVGGTRHQPISQTVRAIEAARADIVGIQEPGRSLDTIGQGLGWNVSSKASVVTKHKIVADWNVEGASWGGAEIELPDGRRVFAYNCHLTAYPYGPYEVRDGNAKTVQEVVDVETRSGRLPQVKAMLADMAQRTKPGDAVVFTGDFNAPSHLDWIDATKNRTFGLVMPWPVSKAVEDAGFKDSYRVIHPSNIRKPGFTWSPGYPVGNFEQDDVMDRIDFVYFRGRGLTVRSAEVVAEKGAVTDIPVDPWPSDHRAVVAGFRLAP